MSVSPLMCLSKPLYFAGFLLGFSDLDMVVDTLVMIYLEVYLLCSFLKRSMHVGKKLRDAPIVGIINTQKKYPSNLEYFEPI